MPERIFLDFNSGCPPCPEAVAAMLAALGQPLGNPSSVHAEGRRARQLLEEARADVARLVGAPPAWVVFTSGGAEANAAALWGLLAAGGRPEGRTLLVSAVEHPSILAFAEDAARLGALVRRVPVGGDGLVDLGALRRRLADGPGDAVVSVQLANSETGVVQPVEEIAALVGKSHAALHCDAVQAAGKLELATQRWGIATLSISGHKFGAPPGIGALVVREGVELAPLIPGTQERHRRGGTENLPGAAGMGVAARLAGERLADWRALSGLRDLLEREVRRELPGASVAGQGSPRLPNTSCLLLPSGLRGGVAVAALDLAGFAVSSGPACSSGVERSGEVLAAMGYGADVAGRSLRVSLAPGVTEGGVMALVTVLRRLLERGAGGGP